MEGDIGMTEVTRGGCSQLPHISFLGFLFKGNTCSDPELWTHGLDVGKWDWPGKSNRMLPRLGLELLLVKKSPDGGLSLCWWLGQIPRQWVSPVGLSLALLLEVGRSQVYRGKRKASWTHERAAVQSLPLPPPRGASST